VNTKREEGIRGEDRATKFLQKKAYKIIEKNFRSPFGEIDIIARDGDSLVFIEVKKRNTPFFGSPFQAITDKKKQHIIRSAMYYLKNQKAPDVRMRFDVVGIEGEDVSVIKGAFGIEKKL